MPSDDEDFVFYGTPIEREEEVTTRKKKAVAEASGQLRTALPPWKQEVTDEEGRRRFHGAFTGGYSAGYYNTVGSKEGWAPQSFSSSRKNRSEVKQQSIYNFLDEDEKAELDGRSLGASMQFDTFGFTAVELARKQAEKEQKQRPSTIPGPVPDELIVPVTESIGVKLLSKMGWRQGRSIKDSNRDSRYDARREARKAFLAFSDTFGSRDAKLDEEDIGNDAELLTDNDKMLTTSTPAYVLSPKQDLYGLGYDPFKQAPEFREKKRLRMAGDRGRGHYGSLSIKGKVGPGFGIGALEELDAEDEDVYASGYEFQDNFVQEIEELSGANVENLRILDKKRQGVLPGFKAASTSTGTLERFDPPAIPKDFVPYHKFTSPLGNDGQNAGTSPPEVPPPEDNNLKVLIEGVATLVARCGKLFEDLSREKNQSNPLFSFLNGGNGFDFYARKLWEERQKRGEQPRLLDEKVPKKSEHLTAESRGKLLGEKALERSSRDLDSSSATAVSINIPFKLSDTFTLPASADNQPDPHKPFLVDPAKQKRFEQFLKEKYEGGLRTKDSGGSSNMSESSRARERLEFEAAAEAIRKGTSGKESKATSQLLADLSATSGLQFTTGGSGLVEHKVKQGEEVVAKAMYPKREEFQWRPAPILCKRFDLVDPYMGKPPPPPRARSKMESLMFLPDFVKTANAEEQIGKEKGSSGVPPSQSSKQTRETAEKEVENEVEVETVERPVDLYKAIFSDDSEDEEENTAAASNQVEDTQKKIEVANTALNRLMAGDFLESLGKELGLALPPDVPASENKAGAQFAQKETYSRDKANQDFLSAEKRFSSPHNIAAGHSNAETAAGNISLSYTPEVRTKTIGAMDGNSVGDDGNRNRNSKIHSEKNLNTQRSRKQGRSSSSSSEDKRSRKRSRSRRRRRDSNSDSDTSADSDHHHDHRHLSRSKRKDKGKSRKERHSKRRRSKHRRKDSSPSPSHRSSQRYESRKSSKYEN